MESSIYDSEGNSQTPICQVYGCNNDLTLSKHYYKKHKVCEVHSKTSKVIVGIEQRFCQQCSRFHLLAEFDDSKRSCRRRLAAHNERRRKHQFNIHSDQLGIDHHVISIGERQGPSNSVDGRTDEDALQHPSNSKNSNRLCIGKISGEKIFSVISFLLLTPTLVFQQLSNKNQPLYGTLAMSFSILTVILSITGFIYRGNKARAIWRWRGRMPWLYYPSPNGTKLFGSAIDIIVLVSAILQCMFSVIGFCFYIKHENNPIKISALPPVFAFGMICAQFLESSTVQNGETAD